MKNAYLWKQLLNQNGLIPNGSDFPVEDINPLYGFYAAVSRKDINALPEHGFQMEEAMTREEALKAMTLWAAYADFDDGKKGSIETGKFADFVILEEDILEVEEKEVPNVKVLSTYVHGEKVY